MPEEELEMLCPYCGSGNLRCEHARFMTEDQARLLYAQKRAQMGEIIDPYTLETLDVVEVPPQEPDDPPVVPNP